MCVERNISKSLIFLLAVSCGVIVANIYYSQTIISVISDTLNMSLKSSGFIVSITQLGYGVGLVFLVPLADKYENKKLILSLIILSIVITIAITLTTSPSLFLIISLLLGVSAVAVQVIVPYVSHLAAATERGRVVGNVMSGLMLGIMMSRPASSFISEFLPWQFVYILSAILMFILLMVLWLKLPERHPENSLKYLEILKSMKMIVVSEPVLRRRSIYQAAMFGCFSLFWTASPLLLLSPVFNFSHQGVALFALAGVAGAIAAPLAGKMADQDKVRKGTKYAMIIAMISFGLTLFCQSGSVVAVFTLTVAAILIDFATALNLVLGQREIFLLNPAFRSRINGIYMATFFLGGSVASALGAWVFVVFGWVGVVTVSVTILLLAFIYFLTEKTPLDFNSTLV
ncbi:UNVERIFIED_CONTAM: hypothetical protein GTU68_018044 [Idotea baltica]|nr:hypothetical protein [Idotea baltica]